MTMETTFYTTTDVESVLTKIIEKNSQNQKVLMLIC